MVEVMSDFLSFLIEDISGNLQLKITEIIARHIRAAVGSTDKYKDIQLTLEKNVFQKTGLSCTHLFEEGCTAETPGNNKLLGFFNYLLTCKYVYQQKLTRHWTQQYHMKT